ncbi:MAG: hypothetical protein ACI942_003249, partial [Planctomycetota bacterium]
NFSSKNINFHTRRLRLKGSNPFKPTLSKRDG